jgi:hypothetical protein
MASFPRLSSGAVTQYPVGLATGQGVQVIRFLDGSDQRYLTQGKFLRAWQVRLDLLNEDEIQGLEVFFSAQLGDYAPFTFPDPISGADVPNCRFGAPGLLTEYRGTDANAVSFWVIEANG